MDEKEKNLRSTITRNLGDIVEGILTKNPKFANIPIHQEAAQSFSHYCKYEEKLKNDIKSRFIKAQIASGRFFCEKSLFGHQGKPFAQRYPEHMKAREDFWNWIKSQEDYSSQIGHARTAPIKKAIVNKCVKQTIKTRHPEFKVDNKAFGSIGYYRNIGFKNKIFLVVDTGSWRTTLSFMFGIDYPKFSMDVAEFFADHQSHYGDGYQSIEQVENAINKALDLVDALMPFYLEAIECAFTDNGLQV
ncbi:MAG: hypothetical protein P8X96_08060 [Desulfobacteraceae bacterium]